MPIDTECPHCHQPNPTLQSSIGHYVTCTNCGCKYWVYVPPPEVGTSKPLREPATAARSNEQQVEMRQESLLAIIHDDLIKLRRAIVIATAILAFLSGVIFVELIRR